MGICISSIFWGGRNNSETFRTVVLSIGYTPLHYIWDHFYSVPYSLQSHVSSIHSLSFVSRRQWAALLCFKFLFQFAYSVLYPWVLKCFFRRYSSIYFPFKALVNKIHEVFIFTVKKLFQTLCVCLPNFSFRIRVDEWIIVIIKELASS